jgi:hypothetical protein
MQKHAPCTRSVDLMQNQPISRSHAEVCCGSAPIAAVNLVVVFMTHTETRCKSWTLGAPQAGYRNTASSFFIFKLEHTRVDPRTRSHGPSRQQGKTSLQQYKRVSRNKKSTKKKYKEGIEKHHTPQSTVLEVHGCAHSYPLGPAVINNNVHVATV